MSFLQGYYHFKFLKVLSVLAVIVCLAGCGSDEPQNESPSQKQSATTINQTKQSVANLEAREAELQAAMDKPPVDLELVYELATVRADLANEAYSRGKEALALDLLTNSLSIDPLQPDRWELLGDWVLEADIPDNQSMANYAYSQAIELRPYLPRTLMKIASVNARFGNWKEALKYVENSLQSPQTIHPEWTHLAFLVQLYIRAEQTGQGMAFLSSRFEETYDDRYLLALAVLMDGLGQGEAAAEIAKSVAQRQLLPEALQAYAKRLAKRFDESGNNRLYGETQAAKSWRSSR